MTSSCSAAATPATSRPSRPACGSAWRACSSNGDAFERLVGNYARPRATPPFARPWPSCCAAKFGWPVTERNIALTNGSQTAFFYLFNMFAGHYPDGSRKKILLPLTPEYIGYTDAGIDDDIFISYRPEIDYLDRLFKYRVDFDALAVTRLTSAPSASRGRPTRPATC
jgi:valine--pyruvate aminotransferase